MGEFVNALRDQAREQFRAVFQEELPSDTDPLIELISRILEDGAGGVHEWFDTGDGAPDPFADPPRAADLPVQRAAGVRVGGRTQESNCRI